MTYPMTWRRLLIALTVLLALTLLLAACGGDDDDEKDDGVTPEATATPEDIALPDETPTPLPTVLPPPTTTPYLPPDEPVFEAAGQQAIVDLAAHNDVSIDELEVLEPDAELYLDRPLECPEPPDDVDVYYVYVQHERFIYAYQVIPPAVEGDAPTVQRCEDQLYDDEVLYIPDAEPTADPVEAVRADLLAQDIAPEMVEAAEIVITDMVWSNNALDCPEDAGIDEPVAGEIAGYLIMVTMNGVTYEYHTDETGAMIVYCAPPPGFDTVDELIARLVLEQEHMEVDPFPAEEEVAIYAGLPVEGTLVEFTLQGYRVGFFGFDTPEIALEAAHMIDDPVVSHIFVSGRVLVVMEENSLQVIGMLQDYAVEVRNVLAEEAADVGIGDDDGDDDDVGDDLAE